MKSQRNSVSTNKDHFEIPTLGDYFKEEMAEIRKLGEDLDETISSTSSRSSVSFQDRLDVIEIPTLDEYSEFELDQMYYSREDQDEFIEDVVDAANGWVVEGQEEPRGLEMFSEEAQMALHEQRRQVIHAVLAAQFKLRECPIEEAEEILAECSYSLTINSQDQAYVRGYNDEVAGVPRRLKKQLSLSDLMGDISRKVMRCLHLWQAFANTQA